MKARFANAHVKAKVGFAQGGSAQPLFWAFLIFSPHVAAYF
jgi:hypothetical protein